MLFKKMLREIRLDFGHFLSIFLLSFLAVMLFSGLESNVIGANQAREKFHEETNLADGWLYGENFSDEDAEKISSLSFVNDVQRRMKFSGSADSEHDNAELTIFVENENLVSKPYIVSGEDFDVASEDGIWLADRFAQAWEIKPGDTFSFSVEGLTITKEVKGLIDSPEYEYMMASDDLKIDFHHIGYIYMSYDGFPFREYISCMIENNTISVSDIIENSDSLDDIIANLEQYGMTKDDITKDMILEKIEKMSEEDIRSMIPFTQMIFTTDEEDVMSHEDEIADAIDDNYAVMLDSSSITGIVRLDDELAQHNSVSWGFSVVFVIIAMLVIFISMNRMVDNQRIQIGTMKALGMKKGKIIFHYISYNLIISLLGSVGGFFVGVFALGEKIVGLFNGNYTVPGWEAGFDATSILIMILVVGGSVLSSCMSCAKILKINPAESLRPAPPRSGKKCIFEFLPFWNKLGFSTQYNLRNITRSKVRTFMGIFGTTCGMILMLASVGSLGFVDELSDWSLEKIQNYDYQASLSDDFNAEDMQKISDQYEGEFVEFGTIEVAAKSNAVSADRSLQTLIVTEGKGLYNLTDVNLEVQELPEGKAALSRKVAEKLNLNVGDTVYWHMYDENTWYEAEIGLISRAPSLTSLTLLRSDFEETNHEFKPSMFVTDEDITGYDGEEIVSVLVKSDLEEAYVNNMSVINDLISVLLVFSVIMIVVVLYSSGNISFHERNKEFATMKVIGFSSKKIRNLITKENIWLSVIGVIIGIPFGNAVLSAMVNSNGENYDYPTSASPVVYLISAAFVLIVSALVSFMFSRRIKKLDMVGSLKGME